jgi:hypothetical protein
MSYQGNGTFLISTAGQPVVTGSTISSTAFNALTADLATGLSTALTKDGQTTPTANIPLGGYKITGLANATLSTDAMAYGQFTAFGTPGYTTTATAAGTTTLTVSSTQQQFFTGVTTQTVVLPVTSTLVLGQTFRIVNMSTGVVTVNSSGGNAVVAMVALAEVTVTCILTSGTTAASWDIQYTGKSAVTGTGSMVLATSPTLVTPTLGVATGTSLALAGALSGVTTASMSGVLTNTVADGSTPMAITSATTVANLKAEAAASAPQNSKSAAYTTVLADAGKHIYHPGADTSARTWTIDSNANVAYPLGTMITFVNDTSAGVITIAITSDTLVLAGAGTTGSRTLAASGMATAIKMTTTRWMISGTGLT